MSNETNDFLGFDPSQLSVFNQSEQSKGQSNPLIYNTSPDLSIDEKKHIYRATIKIIYNPFKYADSIVEQQTYGLQDENGWFSVVSSLTNGDKNCPIFKAWKKCHYAKKDENPVLWKQAAKEEEGGNALFDKRFARYVTIQVIEDKNQPEKVGQYLIWKLPSSIWEIIEQKQKPSTDEKAPIPVMDFLFGRSFEIEVVPGPGKPGEERYNRERSYRVELSEDVTQVINPDGSPILSDSEQDVLDTYVSEIKKVWKCKNPEERDEMIAAINEQENTKEFRKIYSRVLTDIKAVCPNLVDEMGYKEWSDNIKTRVNKWIDKVLAGQNPTEAAVVTTPSAPAETKNETPKASVATPEAPAPAAAEDEDDLPF